MTEAFGSIWLKSIAITLGLLIGLAALKGLAAGSTQATQTFTVSGVVMELSGDGKTLTVRHEAISNYMAAMTMPFQVLKPAESAGLHPGDKISFRLHVTESESWIADITKVGTVAVALPVAEKQHAGTSPPLNPHPPLLDCGFTNELGQAVCLNDFRGQALAITFFYTRCPLPEYCPRLSMNFQEALQKLKATPNAPTNWHFLSVSFDPVFDTPAMLKAYGQRYHYDPAHWSFLTGPADKISELARQAGISYQLENGTYNHNFRTLIVDAAGRLQTIFPTAGDLSDPIVSEILKAATATNVTASGQ
jgi:protein SCO1/2